jgi:hypothetical protein
MVTGRRLQEAKFYPVVCEGSQQGVIDLSKCEIKLEQLRGPPWNLKQGDDINIKIVAGNQFGSSVSSLSLSG